MNGMLRRVTVLVALTVTNVGGVASGWDTDVADDVAVSAGQRRVASAAARGPSRASPMVWVLTLRKLPSTTAPMMSIEQERQDEDELERDDASVVTVGAE